MSAQGAEILDNIIKKLQTARALRFTSAPSPSSLKFSNKKIRISKLRSMPPSPSESAKKFISNGDALHMAKAKTHDLVSLPSGLKSEALDLRNENTPLLLSSASASASGSSVFINITNGNGSNHNNRRRRVASDGDIPSLAHSRRHSFRNDVGHAAAETYLVTRLSFQLLRYLGIGYRWITKFLALGLYAACLLPGFIQIGYYYYFSKCVRRSVVYGKEPRNRLDLYIPEDTNEPKPVVAFVTGGAWIIGYKAWGALLAQELVERGVIVACIDYRNFPQGTVSDMVNDASEGVSFVCKNIAEYGGDPDRIYLVGQSAGAHIAACVLVDQAHKEVLPERKELSWTVSQIKAYFGISGGYNLLTLVEHFHRRGLYRSIFLGIMEGEQSLASFSPELVVQTASFKDAISLLPPIVLLHGTGDYSIPSEASTNFADSLRSVGAKVEVILYEGKTHTDIFLQDPMRGGKDQVIEDILSFIHAGDPAAQAVDANRPPRRRLVPEFLLRLATKLSPF